MILQFSPPLQLITHSRHTKYSEPGEKGAVLSFDTGTDPGDHRNYLGKMTGPGSTSGVPKEDQPVSHVQETLIQLVIEQNRLLRQLVEREPDDSYSALLPEPEYTQKEWDLDELQSRWGNENALKSASRLLNWVKHYLRWKEISKGLDLESCESRVITLSEGLREVFSPINRDPKRRIMFSRCNSTEYHHPQTEDEKLPSAGSVWCVLLIVP